MSGILNSLQGILGRLRSTFYTVLDRIFPPEQRAEVISKLQNFAFNNPKLAAFLTTQIALTGLPLLLFAAFSLTVFLFSLVTALLVGLLAAVLFTLFMVGVALVIVLPTIFMTTFAASFLFLWGLGGYYILKLFNEGESPAPQGTAIGDKLNSLTGGRMSWLVEGAKKKQEDVRTGVDNTPKVHGSDSGSEKRVPRKLNKEDVSTDGSAGTASHPNPAKTTATAKADEAQKRANKSAGGTSNEAETAKGSEE